MREPAIRLIGGDYSRMAQVGWRQRIDITKLMVDGVSAQADTSPPGSSRNSYPRKCARASDPVLSTSVVTQSFDGRQQVVAPPFEHKGRSSDLEGSLLDVRIAHRREHDDFRFRVRLRELTTRLQSVDLGQVDVDHNHVGLESLRSFQHGLMTLATPIVQLLFEHGRFGPADTAQTAAALRLYAVGLIGYSTARIVSPTFYALRESKIPVAVSMGSIALNVVLGTALVEVIGFRGLALGTALAALFDGALLMFLLRQRLNGIGGAKLAVALTKVTLAGLVMAAATVGVEWILTGIVVGGSVYAQAVRLSLEIVTGLAVLAVAAKLLQISEFADAVALLRSRLGSSKRAAL